MIQGIGVLGTVIIIIIALYLISSIKILAEYERGVIFRLGRLLATAKGPGVILVFVPLARILSGCLQQSQGPGVRQEEETHDTTLCRFQQATLVPVVVSHF